MFGEYYAAYECLNCSCPVEEHAWSSSRTQIKDFMSETHACQWCKEEMSLIESYHGQTDKESIKLLIKECLAEMGITE